jgi:Ca-activated chloride channel family protein
MEQIANKGNGNYFYVDDVAQAKRVFGRDLTKMLQDVAQDVKIQVAFDPRAVARYRLIGYENRDLADKDFRNDRVDAGEIGAGHQVTALYAVELAPGARGRLGTVFVRAKKPRGMTAKESALEVPVAVLDRDFDRAPDDLRFAIAVMGAAEIFRHSAYAKEWRLDQIAALARDAGDASDSRDRAEFVDLIERAQRL